MEDNEQGSPPAEPTPKKRGQKRGPGRPKLFEPEITETMRKRVESMAGLGHTEEEIAVVIGVDVKTFRKYFLKAYKTGAVKAVYNVATVLYEQAVKERDPDQVRYFLSHRSPQWRDQQKVELSGAVAVESPLTDVLGQLARLKKPDNGG